MENLSNIGITIAYNTVTTSPDSAFDVNDSTYWNADGAGLVNNNYIGRNFGKKCIVQ